MPGIEGETLRAWRRSRGWDVPEMARQLRCAAREARQPVAAHDGLIRMIYSWERGDHELSERYELLYVAALGVEAADLGHGPRQDNGIPRSYSAPEPWELADAITRSSVSLTTLDFMEQAITDFAVSYPFTPPWEMTPRVGAMLRRMKDVLDLGQPIRVRARCVRLAGILCGVAGQLADDTGRFNQASGYFGAAELAGAESGDGDLTAWVLAIRSIGLFFRREYASAAEVLERAEAAAAASSERRRAWLAALSARAHAALWSRPQDWDTGRRAVMASLDSAYTQMDRVTGSPHGTEFFDAPRLAGIAGTTLLLMRDTGRAKELLGDALAHRSAADAKGRALLTLDLADCSVIEGEPEHAAQLGAEALDMVRGAVVRPVVVRAQMIGDGLRSSEDAAAVRDLKERLTEITEAGAGG